MTDLERALAALGLDEPSNNEEIMEPGMFDYSKYVVRDEEDEDVEEVSTVTGSTTYSSTTGNRSGNKDTTITFESDVTTTTEELTYSRPGRVGRSSDSTRRLSLNDEQDDALGIVRGSGRSWDYTDQQNVTRKRQVTQSRKKVTITGPDLIQNLVTGEPYSQQGGATSQTTDPDSEDEMDFHAFAR